MTDNELNNFLRSADVPRPSAQFEEDLPQTVLLQVRRGVTVPETHVESFTLFQAIKADLKSNIYSVGLAASLIVAALAVGLFLSQTGGPRITDSQLANAGKWFSELRQLFPNQLRGIVLRANDPSLMLSERPDVPDSEPVLLHLEGQTGSASMVVLNGQEFSWAGKRYEVLLDHRGDILVIGPDLAWSSLQQEKSPHGIKIAARVLKMTS